LPATVIKETGKTQLKITWQGAIRRVKQVFVTEQNWNLLGESNLPVNHYKTGSRHELELESAE